MAKLFSPPDYRRGPSIRGRFYIYATRHGLIAVSWPKKRGAPRTPDQAATMQLFIDAQKAIKLMNGETVINAHEAVVNSQFFARDLLVKMLYGRGPPIFFADGRRWYPLATRLNVSELLDNLGYVPGSMLFRGADTWIVVPPGLAGQVLTLSSPTAAAWATPATPPPVTGHQLEMNTFNANDTGAHATKGNFFIPAQNTKINGIMFGASEIAGKTYFASIFVCAVATLGTKIVQTPTVTAAATVLQTRLFPTTSEVTLTAGVRYAILHTRNDATTTTSNGLQRGFDFVYGIPQQQSTQGCILDSIAPAVGNVVSAVFNQFFFGFDFHL